MSIRCPQALHSIFEPADESPTSRDSEQWGHTCTVIFFAFLLRRAYRLLAFGFT